MPNDTKKNLEQELFDDLCDRFGLMLTRAQVEKALAISQRTAQRLLQDGQIESSRIGTHYRVPARSVARFAAMGVAPNKPR